MSSKCLPYNQISHQKQKMSQSETVDISSQYPKHSQMQQTMNPYEQTRIKRTIPRSLFRYAKTPDTTFSNMLVEDQKIDYISTFKNLIQSRQVTSQDRETWRNKTRIQLPYLEQNEQSKFTMLEPMSVTADFLKQSADIAQQGLEKNSQQAKKLNQDLQQLNNHMTNTLKDIEKFTFDKLNFFRNLMKQNSISQQQKKCDTFQQVKILRSEINDLQQKFDHSLWKVQNLQEFVFRGLPYQLVQNPNNQLDKFQEKLF